MINHIKTLLGYTRFSSIIQFLEKGLSMLGHYAQIPAAWIDDIYLQDTPTLAAKTIQFFKTRLIFTVHFSFSNFVDLLANAVFALVWKAKSLFNSTDNKQLCTKKSVKYYNQMVKNCLGLLGFFIGILLPNLVSFYFIPRNKINEKVLAGGHLYSASHKQFYPRNRKELQKILKDAVKNHQTVAVRGAGYSQGKQFLPADKHGVLIDMKNFNKITIHPSTKTVTVGAGATWGNLQLSANEQKLAIKVQQASNVFSVGGSLSTNIHGWHKTGTLATTVKSVSLLDPQGKFIKLKPQDKLFGYVVGGYGQFGIILEAEFELADNELLQKTCQKVRPDEYVKYFKEIVVKNINNRMHSFRLSVDPDKMLKDGIAVNYNAFEKTVVLTTPHFSQEPEHGTRTQRILLNIARRFSLFRKICSWFERFYVARQIKEMTTNEIMQPNINALFNNAMSESEWLQEYFLPEKKLAPFIKDLGNLLMQNKVALLNATVRYVKKDNISKMGYANKGDRFAVVLCFNQRLNPAAVAKTKALVQEATERALAYGGTYYLPYQPFASQIQFQRGYPNATQCRRKKMEVDPNLTFKSGFAEQYLAPLIKPSDVKVDKPKRKSPSLIFSATKRPVSLRASPRCHHEYNLRKRLTGN